MTTAADDVAAEEAFEAFLAGRPVPEETAGTFAGVAAFADAVRTTATEPGRPHAALAQLLATGLLTDQSSPSTVAARSAGTSLRRPSRVRRRRRSAMFFFPALVAKILSAGAIAQAATGAGIVVVAFTGAGAAGVLPGPVQDTVATVIETVTPFDVHDSHDPVEPADTTVVPAPTTATETSEPTETTPATATTEPAEPTSTAPNSFGKRVSEDAKDGGVDGQEISKEAHDRNEARKSGSVATGTAVRTKDDDEGQETESGKTRATGGRTSDDGRSSKHGGSGDD